jgi:hypothetical protein
MPGASAAFSGGFRGGREFRWRDLLGAWRQCDVGVAKQIGDRLRDVGADQPIIVAMADAHLLQAIEIAKKYLPFRHNASLARQVFQALLHSKREERTEYVAAYRGVRGMEDRPRPHHRLVAGTGFRPGTSRDITAPPAAA